MEKRTLWLIACLCVAALISLYVTASYFVSIAKYDAAVAECLAVKQATKADLRCRKEEPHKTWTIAVEDKVLRETTYANPIEQSIALFATMLIVGLIPHMWLFFLNRIRELGDAIRGK